MLKVADKGRVFINDKEVAKSSTDVKKSEINRDSVGNKHVLSTSWSIARFNEKEDAKEMFTILEETD